MRNLKHCTKGSYVSKHTWTFYHVIDFNNSNIIDKANNRSRKTLESWHTAKTVGADNNSCLLPKKYHILLLQEKRAQVMRNLKHCTKDSNVTKRTWTFYHVIDFNNSKIIGKVNNWSRKTLESWHTAKTVRVDNNLCPLLRQYHILLLQEKRTHEELKALY